MAARPRLPNVPGSGAANAWIKVIVDRFISVGTCQDQIGALMKHVDQRRIRDVLDIHRAPGQDPQDRRQLPARCQDSQPGVGELRACGGSRQIENVPPVFRSAACSARRTVSAVVAAVGPVIPSFVRVLGVRNILVEIGDAVRQGIVPADGNAFDRPALQRDDETVIARGATAFNPVYRTESRGDLCWYGRI